MAHYTSPTFDVNLNPKGFIVDLDSLYTHLARIRDTRDPRGVRYALVTVLVFLVLAKLAGQDRLSGVVDWVKHRQLLLAEALHLKKPRSPSHHTFSRALGEVIAIRELDQVVHDFFAEQPNAGQSIHIALDGKTLRGTIRAGETHGVHLLAAYLPSEGWVLMQVSVPGKQNEITAAPTILKCLDLRGKIITGDAMHAQRELSAQIVEAGGEYVWNVKDNQSQLRQDIETLFQPERTVKGFSPGTKDFRTQQTIEKSHGRLEQRKLTVSAELQGYLNWPGAEQVFKLERQFKRVADGQVTFETVYGVTSLTAQEVSPQRLLELVRNHWRIENGLHYRRDETLREDWCHLRRGHAARAMATLNNLVIGLVLGRGQTNVPAARRYYDAYPGEAVKLILFQPSRL